MNPASRTLASFVPTRRQTVNAGASWACVSAWLVAACLPMQAAAQQYPVTAQQKATAQQVAQTGVALSELAPDAPASHTVKRGDTLWAISGVFLRSPWRWPELWGMNLSDIRNPHRIYPGQVLVLDTSSGRGVLRVKADDGEPPTVRVSPRTRYESLADAAIPMIPLRAIEPFLAEAQIVDEQAFAQAPRIVAAQEGRVLLSKGDRAYARSLQGTGEGGLSMEPGEPRKFRVFRSAKPLKDPTTGDVLGFEAQFVGKVQLVRGEALREVTLKDGKTGLEIEPATLDVVGTKEEIRVGDRMLVDTSMENVAFAPRAPVEPVSGQIVSVYGDAVRFAGQNQVVVINRGHAQGLEVGHVLAVQKDGLRMVDRTDANRATIRLPGERNGLMIVFRTFERLSYALVLDITDGVKVGDRFANP
ncbi:MAG TPA: LysM peptidoglycan-binding domain-containing protein [Burkholderiaceae bacterium]|nr:LysM peptidoglycan-binding domain-containing protein [Burkholderiaceae bacterium]